MSRPPDPRSPLPSPAEVLGLFLMCLLLFAVLGRL